MEQPFIQPLAWGEKPEKEINPSIEARLSALEGEDKSRDLALDQYRSFLESKIQFCVNSQAKNVSDFGDQVVVTLNSFMGTINECVASVNALEKRVRELESREKNV